MAIAFAANNRVGPFIADFACPALMLIIEVNGDSHNEREAYDAIRTTKLEALGYSVIRFTNTDVNGNFDAVVEAIAAHCAVRSRRPSPPPSPRVQGEGARNSTHTNIN